MQNANRRDFLKFSALSSTLLAANPVFAKTEALEVANGKENYPNAGYTENMYRDEFSFTYGNKEEHGYAFHCVNCQGNCAWEVWSNDGVVTRENQSSRYPIINSRIPDFNPRGCNKGVQHSQVMYEKDRLLTPLKRVGERGEGKWKQISWDEATTEVAEKIFEVITDENKGPGKIFMQPGTGILSEGRRAAGLRFGTQLGANRIYPASYLGDMFSGSAVAFAEGNIGCTTDFFYTMDVNVLWGANPSVSRIPDAHFVWEGKYNGSKIITITPEFNATASSSDLWIPIKAGTDHYLAMSVIHEIINDKMYKEGFMKVYTDLPFLVIKDSKKLLRRIDLEDAHDEEHEKHYKDEFYSMNSVDNKIALMPGTHGSEEQTLLLKDVGKNIDPYLEGEWDVTLKDGSTVRVTTAFEILKENVKKFSPEETQQYTGVHPKTVKILAENIAKPKKVLITTGFSLNKYFHGVLSVWNIASICGLAGKMGAYGGLNTENEWSMTGIGDLGGFQGKYNPRFGSGFVGEFVLGDGMKSFDKYFNDDDVQRAQGMSKSEYKKVINKMIETARYGDGPGKPSWLPDIAILMSDSRFRRNKGPDYQKAFLERMKFLAAIDYRMSNTALYADIVLPARSHYEVWDIRTNPGYHRFTNLAYPVKNLQNVGDALDEWRIFALIAKKIQEIANRPENVDKAKVPDDEKYAKDGFRDLSIFYEEYTNTDMDSQMNLDPELGTDFMAVKAALEVTKQYEPNTIEKMYKNGGFLQINEKAGMSSTLYADKPYNTFDFHLFKFKPFHTLSGRQTFYVDHPIWIELGANTNTAIPNMRINTKAEPYMLMTPHARWSIHSNYKNSPTLQRLQRGKPYAQVNPDIAEIKGIKDGDEIRIFNKLGEFYAMAKISSSAPHDCLVMEHGWEPYFFKNKINHNVVQPMSLNLLEMADGWGHLTFGPMWDGNQYAYDGAINFEKA
ncbi:MAG: molybdopterin-dependent oxidoreductase [Campylobacterales bacterium]